MRFFSVLLCFLVSGCIKPPQSNTSTKALIARYDVEKLTVCRVQLGWTIRELRRHCGPPIAVRGSTNPSYDTCYIYRTKAQAFTGGPYAPYIAACMSPTEEPSRRGGDYQLTVQMVLGMSEAPTDQTSEVTTQAPSCPGGERLCPDTGECISANAKCPVEQRLEKVARKRQKSSTAVTVSITLALVAALVTAVWLSQGE